MTRESDNVVSQCQKAGHTCKVSRYLKSWIFPAVLLVIPYKNMS